MTARELTSMGRSHGRNRVSIAVVGACVALAVLASASPAAAEGSAWWRLDSTAAPTKLPRTGEAQLIVTATNLGDREVNASPEHPVTITDRLPAGVRPTAVNEFGSSVVRQATCPQHPSGQVVTCTFTGKLAPYESLTTRIIVEMEEPTEAPLFNVVAVEGGQTPSPELLKRPLTLEKVAEEETPFGIEDYELIPESEDGSLDTRAGSHPFQLTTVLDFNQALVEYAQAEGGGFWPSAPALPHDLHLKLPPGLVGDPSAVPKCSTTDFATEVESHDVCPEDTQVGVATVTVYEPKIVRLYRKSVPVFNLEPEPGEPASFGFVVDTVAGMVPVVLKTAVPSGGNYGVEVNVVDVSEAAQVLSSAVTLWGVPGDPRHNSSRGWGCLQPEETKLPCEPFTESTPKAFLTLPTSCEQPLTSTVGGDSWPTGQPGNEGSVLAPEHTEYRLPSLLTGCPVLGFEPAISMEPEQHSASTPSGLSVTVSMPQEGLLSASGLAESALQEAIVALPEGMQLNPSAANALEDCSVLDFGSLNGPEAEGGRPLEGAEEELQTANKYFTKASPDCPDAAKLGTVNIQTPLLPNELTGSLYLAAQNTNPFRSPLAMYLVAEDKNDGIRVKLVGEVRMEESTGQIVTMFRNGPELPFSNLELHLFGGQRGSLSTPPLCGSYTAETKFTPWSDAQPARPQGGFTIKTGPGGTPCPSNPLPFAPSLKAYSESGQAGGFSPFTLTISRPDGQQQLTGITMHLPPGIAGLLSKVTPCLEPPVGEEWSCGPDSMIGHSVATAGLGSEPVTLPGNAYLTIGYDGAPFGVLVQTPAVAGPFNLGMINVRSRINVDPSDASVTITTDPGPRDEAIPARLKGVPAQLQRIQVSVNRPEFLFNPTNCNPLTIAGSLDGNEGASVPLSYPFQVANCATLPFAPKLTAEVAGQGSKANGTSLTVKLESGGVGPTGVVQANIAKVDLTIPAALPSRLTTIQKACLAAVFEANPASCDEGSVIGNATVHTPVLSSPLTGPGYLVSHGGAEFPDVEFVLQGEGIKLVLDGKTDIKKGVTYSKFESAPDAPFTTFETNLPAGPHSAFTPNVPEKENFNLCRTSLSMPTTITGQNGAVIEQDTKIAVTGCHGVKAFKVTKLEEALKACQKKHKQHKSKRLACEKRARKKYGVKKAAKSSEKNTKK